MQNKDWNKVKELLDQVLELDVNERQAFLNKCGADQEVRAEIESLISFEDEAENLMNFSAIEFSKDFFADEESPNSLLGQNIGVYRIIRELGMGGMGAVYLAERTDGEFEQKVALKLLKREVNTSAIRRRFQIEREILAALEHPNIARLLNAGTTDEKVPYLVMEYVEGLPIDEYCNTQKLDLGQRLDLFRKVCEVVNFAHRNLIVHRDLKPSNILVNMEGIPKLLDFGISKILSAGLEPENSATVTRLGAMTPSYASPEQLQNKSVTTSTDIYSLGVILYELLSGYRPFEVNKSNQKEIYKAVLETDPTAPSERISELGWRNSDSESRTAQFSANTDNQKQNTNLKSQISRLKLKGDLDNIVLKALRKEPERRYSSAEHFAEDIHRHQRGLPVTARPNTLSYRAEKFIKRNRVGVFAGFLILLAVIGGITATLWQARVAAAERDRARLEAAKAEKINAFLQNVLNLSNPMWLSGSPESNQNATIMDAVDEAAKTVETDLSDQPEIQAEINFTLGKTYFGQGKYKKSREQLVKAKERFSQILTDNSLKQKQIDIAIGATDFFEGGKFDNEPMLRDAVLYFRSNIDKSEEHKKWYVVSLNVLALTLQRDPKKVDELEKLLREALQYGLTLQGQDRWVLINVFNNLASIPSTKIEEDIELYETGIQEANSLSNKPRSDTGIFYLNLGMLYKDQKNYAEAKKVTQKAYEIFRQTLGEENTYTILSHRNMAYLYYLEGDYKNAKIEIETAVRNIQKQSLKRPNLYLNFVEEIFALILSKTGETERAEKVMREVVSSYSALMKSPHLNIARSNEMLGEILIERKKYREAKEALLKAEKEFTESLGENDPKTKRCRELLSKISA